MDLIERSALLKDLDDLKKSPWYNIDNPFIRQGMRECMDMIETQCIKKALAEDAIPVEWIEQFIKKENIDIINKIGIVDMVEKWKLHPIDFEISSEKCGAKMDGEDEQPSSEDCDQISEFVMERLKAEKTLERLGQILGEVFGKINETIDDCCNEFLKEEEKKNETE